MKFFCSHCGQGLDTGNTASAQPVLCPACGLVAAPPDLDDGRRRARRAIITACALALLALLLWLLLGPDTGFGAGLRGAVFGHHLAARGTGASASGNRLGRGGPQSHGIATTDSSNQSTVASSAARSDNSPTSAQPTVAPPTNTPIAGATQPAPRETVTEQAPAMNTTVAATNVSAPSVVRINPGSPATGTVGAASAPGFFGSRGKGTKFVYVVDRSSSMHAGNRFEAARDELLKSLRSLLPGMSFFVIFYDNRYESMPATTLQPVARLQEFVPWIERQQPGGGTDPKEAMMAALKLKPDTIWLLSDGQFSDFVVQDIRLNNPGKKVAINTIAFHDQFGERVLKQIAQENNGEYRYVPPPAGAQLPRGSPGRSRIPGFPPGQP